MNVVKLEVNLDEFDTFTSTLAVLQADPALANTERSWCAADVDWYVSDPTVVSDATCSTASAAKLNVWVLE